MNSLFIILGFYLALVVSSVMAKSEETSTLDFVSSMSAMFFTLLFERNAVSKGLSKMNLFKRFLSTNDQLTESSNPTSFAQTLWSDPVVRVISGLTIVGLAAQILGTPYGYVSIKRRKRNFDYNWPW